MDLPEELRDPILLQSALEDLISDTAITPWKAPIPFDVYRLEIKALSSLPFVRIPISCNETCTNILAPESLQSMSLVCTSPPTSSVFWMVSRAKVGWSCDDRSNAVQDRMDSTSLAMATLVV